MLYSTKMTLVLSYILNSLDDDNHRKVIDGMINSFLNNMIKNIKNKKWNIPKEFMTNQDSTLGDVEVKNWNYYKIICFISKNSFFINKTKFKNKYLCDEFKKAFNKYFSDLELPRDFIEDSMDIIEDISKNSLNNFNNLKGEQFYKIINFDRTIADPMRFFDIMRVTYDLSKQNDMFDEKKKIITIDEALSSKIMEQLRKDNYFNSTKDGKKTPFERLKTLLKPISQFSKNINNVKSNKKEFIFPLDSELVDNLNNNHYYYLDSSPYDNNVNFQNSPYEGFLVEFLKFLHDKNHDVQKFRKNSLYFLINVLSLFWELKKRGITKLDNNELILFVMSLKKDLDYKDILDNIVKYHEEIINTKKFEEKFDFFINKFLIERDIKLSSWESISNDANQLKNCYLKYTKLFDVSDDGISLSKIYSDRIRYMMENFEDSYFNDDKKIETWMENFCTLRSYIEYMYENDENNLTHLCVQSLKNLHDKINEISNRFDFDIFKEIALFENEKEMINKLDIKEENINKFDMDKLLKIFYWFDAIEYNLEYKFKRLKTIYNREYKKECEKKNLGLKQINVIKEKLKDINNTFFIGYWQRQGSYFENTNYIFIRYKQTIFNPSFAL